MLRVLTMSLLIGALAAGPVVAATFDVEMLNRSDVGALPYAPDYLEIAPGDTIRFISTTSGHNAQSIEGMLPEGAEPFATPLGQDAEITFEVPGIYGIKCTPHFGMGMVMLVRVGDAPLDPAVLDTLELPDRARERFADIMMRHGLAGEVAP